MLTQAPRQGPGHPGRRPHVVRARGYQEHRPGNQLDGNEGVCILTIRAGVVHVRQRPAVEEPRWSARWPASRHDVPGNRRHHPAHADGRMDRGQHRRFAAPGHAEHRERDAGQFVMQDLQSGKEVLKGDGAKLLRQPGPREVRDRQGSDSLASECLAHIGGLAATRSADQQDSRARFSRDKEGSMHWCRRSAERPGGEICHEGHLVSDPTGPSRNGLRR